MGHHVCDCKRNSDSHPATTTMSTIPGLGWAPLKGSFQNGANKLAIPMNIHQSARTKLISEMRKIGITSGVVILEGGKQMNQYDSDTEIVFRQDSWFNFLFGVKESEFYGAVDLSSGECTLFMPKLPESYRIWCGTIHPPLHFKDMYSADEVLFDSELQSYLQEHIINEGDKIYLLYGQNSDSGSFAKPAEFEGKDSFEKKGCIDTTSLFPALSTARVTKNAYEIDVMHYCALVASNAHVEVMRNAYVGMMEYELEAKFQYEIYTKGGCRKAAYTSICACGPNPSVLHYGHAGAPNDRQVLNGESALCDMGAEYHGYVSDITCSFPISISKAFTESQKAIYNGVLNAQIAVYEGCRPGVFWTDMHTAAYKCILQALVDVGILTGGIDEMIAANMGAVFMPHGLGHFIGCDTHDVGGYLPGSPERNMRPGYKSLRTARALEEGMVLTNEPGCYFINPLLDDALANSEQSCFINNDILIQFRNSGGFRLEDVFVITADGCTNLTTCPRTVSEVESVLQGGVWPPVTDECPLLRRQWCKVIDGKIEKFSL